MGPGIGVRPEALVLPLVGRLLVGARVDREARRVVLEIAGEHLVDLERDLDELVSVRLPAVSEELVRIHAPHRQLVLHPARIDLRRRVLVVRAVVGIAARRAIDEVGERRLRGLVLGDGDPREIRAGHHHGLDGAVGRDRRIDHRKRHRQARSGRRRADAGHASAAIATAATTGLGFSSTAPRMPSPPRRRRRLSPPTSITPVERRSCGRDLPQWVVGGRVSAGGRLEPKGTWAGAGRVARARLPARDRAGRRARRASSTCTSRPGRTTITPGANLILLDTNQVPKPTRGRLHDADAAEPALRAPERQVLRQDPAASNVIHLHHGVWLSNGAAGAGEGNGYGGGFYPFMAAGEEKTIYEFPPGYGYPIGANDFWVLNYMIHDLTDRPAKVYITYDIDFVPRRPRRWRRTSRRCTRSGWTSRTTTSTRCSTSTAAAARTASSRSRTWPRTRMASGPPLNEFTVDHPGTLIATAGHLHPGGLYDDLDLIRPGRHAERRRDPRAPCRNSVRLFRSNAHYWDKRGPISWDMAMTATAAGLAPAGQGRRRAADQRHLRDQARLVVRGRWGSWSCGRRGTTTTGVDPFTHKLDQNGPRHPRPPGREQRPRRLDVGVGVN